MQFSPVRLSVIYGRAIVAKKHGKFYIIVHLVHVIIISLY